jgi:hypothetical protein
MPKPFRSIDFTRTTKEHWAGYDNGDAYDTQFTIRGAKIAFGDYMLVRMQSGRIARYRVFSVRRDYTGRADWVVRATAIGYVPMVEQAMPPVSKIKGLLGDGSGGIRSNASQPAHLPNGFTKPTSEFWKILVRDEVSRDRTNSMRTTGNL